MAEQDKEYVISPGKLLVLEAGLPHEGYRACEEDAEICRLHVLLAALMAALQAECARTALPEPAVRLARAAAAYLDDHWRAV